MCNSRFGIEIDARRFDAVSAAYANARGRRDAAAAARAQHTATDAAAAAQDVHEALTIVVRQERVEYRIDTTVRVGQHLACDLYEDHWQADARVDRTVGECCTRSRRTQLNPPYKKKHTFSGSQHVANVAITPRIIRVTRRLAFCCRCSRLSAGVGAWGSRLLRFACRLALPFVSLCAALTDALPVSQNRCNMRAYNAQLTANGIA